MLHGLSDCPSYSHYCWDDTPWPKQCGEERVYLAYSPSPEEAKTRAQSRNSEAGAKVETMEECCFLIHYLLNLFHKQFRPSCPGVALSTDQSLIKKIPHRHSHRLIWWRQCLNWSPIFSGDSMPSFQKLIKDGFIRQLGFGRRAA